MLLSHCNPMCYLLSPENFSKLYSFVDFSGGKKRNIGLIWDKSAIAVSFDYHKHSSIYCWIVHVKVVVSMVVVSKIIHQLTVQCTLWNLITCLYFTQCFVWKIFLFMSSKTVCKISSFFIGRLKTRFQHMKACLSVLFWLCTYFLVTSTVY